MYSPQAGIKEEPPCDKSQCQQQFQCDRTVSPQRSPILKIEVIADDDVIPDKEDTPEVLAIQERMATLRAIIASLTDVNQGSSHNGKGSGGNKIYKIVASNNQNKAIGCADPSTRWGCGANRGIGIQGGIDS